MQVDPLKPSLKGPGSERLKLQCDDLLAFFAFTFNLRRYTVLAEDDWVAWCSHYHTPRVSDAAAEKVLHAMCSGLASPLSSPGTNGQGLTLVHFSAQPEPFLTQNAP